MIANRPRRGWRAWTALAAVYLFVLQAVVSTLPIAAQAAPASDDLFRFAICGSPPDDTGPGSEPHPAAAHDQGCCTAACSMAACTPMATAGSPVLFPDAAVATTVAGLSDRTAVASIERSPQKARAPPQQA